LDLDLFDKLVAAGGKGQQRVNYACLSLFIFHFVKELALAFGFD